MRNMLAFLAAVALTVAAVGWYLDWYKVGTAPGSSGHRVVTVDIDPVKIGKDVHNFSENAQKKLAASKKPASPGAEEVKPAIELPGEPQEYDWVPQRCTGP